MTSKIQQLTERALFGAVMDAPRNSLLKLLNRKPDDDESIEVLRADVLSRVKDGTIQHSDALDAFLNSDTRTLNEQDLRLALKIMLEGKKNGESGFFVMKRLEEEVVRPKIDKIQEKFGSEISVEIATEGLMLSIMKATELFASAIKEDKQKGATLPDWLK